MTSRVNCCVYGCLNQYGKCKLSFFKLPSDCEKRNEWLKLVGRTDLLEKDDIKCGSYRVCSQHFEESMMVDLNMKKLLPNAMPTIRVVKESEKANPQPSTSKTKPTFRTFNISTQTNDLQEENSLRNSENTPRKRKLPTDLREPERKGGTLEIELGKIKQEVEDNDSLSPSRPGDDDDVITKRFIVSTQTKDLQEENNSENTPKNRKLRTDLQEPDRKRGTKEIELNKIKQEAEDNNSLYLSPPGDDDDEITKRFQHLLKWRNSIKNKYKSNRSTDFKLFALDLYYSSPQTYRCLKSILKLPNKSTLSRLKLNIRPSQIDDRIFDVISIKLQSLPDAAKYCTLCVDEMTLKRHLYYDIRHDEVIGLYSVNGNVKSKTAANAFVVMLRGIAVNWEQPIGYALLESARHYKELDNWINAVILKLFSMGVVVKAIVSNQEQIFDKYVADLKKVTPEKPYFTLCEHKIYYIYDVPHLLNCIRNHLLTRDFNYEDKIISWEYIRRLHSKLDLKLLPKITQAHIFPTYFQRMQLKYAVQIFSQTVHRAMNILIIAKLLPEEAKETSEFVKLLNDLFDILNSSKLKTDNKYQRAFNLNEDLLEVLAKAQDTFSKITAYSKRKRDVTIKLKCFTNFQITIQSIIMLSKDLKVEGLNYIFTRKLNQEPLKNFMEEIQGGICKEPTPIQFRRAFSKLYIKNMLKRVPSSNCQDLCDLLLNGDRVLSKLMNAEANPAASIIVSLDVDDYTFDLPTENAITYVSAYILFKCSQKHHCSEFDAYATNTKHLKTVAQFAKVNEKSNFYEDLKLPPKTFRNYIKLMLETFIDKFDDVVVNHPANTLINLLKTINFTPCPCFPSDYIVKLFVRFCMYAVIKYNNRIFKEGNKYIVSCFI